VGYVFGYHGRVTDDGILVTFLGGIVRILFRFDGIELIAIETYGGGRVSWDVIRWGKCPHGTEALRVTLKRGAYKAHMVVFDDIDATQQDLHHRGITVDKRAHA
jgi:hypothetical protein